MVSIPHSAVYINSKLLKSFTISYFINFNKFQYSNSMCSALACRISSTDNSCVFTNGFGAAEGTTCHSGRVCYFLSIHINNSYSK